MGRMIGQIQPCPTPDEVRIARDVISNWRLHYYQLLYNDELTNPGPFSVIWAEGEYRSPIIRFNENHAYDFSPSNTQHLPQNLVDAQVLNNCDTIIKAARERRAKKHRLSCCPLDEGDHCVCEYKTKCVVHGSRCHGSHD